MLTSDFYSGNIKVPNKTLIIHWRNEIMQTVNATLNYEVGVLLFNLSGLSDNALKITNDFDAEGCISTVISAAGIEKEDTHMKEGFFAEGQNYKMDKEELEELYEEALDLLECWD